MRATLVTPITKSARQQTTMKYGLRIENRGIWPLLLPMALSPETRAGR